MSFVEKVGKLKESGSVHPTRGYISSHTLVHKVCLGGIRVVAMAVMMMAVMMVVVVPMPVMRLFEISWFSNLFTVVIRGLSK